MLLLLLSPVAVGTFNKFWVETSFCGLHASIVEFDDKLVVSDEEEEEEVEDGSESEFDRLLRFIDEFSECFDEMDRFVSESEQQDPAVSVSLHVDFLLLLSFFEFSELLLSEIISVIIRKSVSV